MNRFKAVCMAGVLVFSCSQTIMAQRGANIMIGYNVGMHTHNRALSFVTERYNATRSYLSEPMKEPKFFRGLNIALDMYLNKGLMDFEWTIRKTAVFAEGKDATGMIQHRDLLQKVNSLNYGFGTQIGDRSEVTGAYLGADFAMIFIKNYTRIYPKGAEKTDYRVIDKEFSLGLAPFIQFTGNRMTLKLYYQMMLLEASYWDVNRSINPGTWMFDDYDNNSGKTHSLGAILRFNLINNKNQ